MAQFAVLFRCIGSALCAKGLKALVGLVPFGESLYEIAEETWKQFRQHHHDQLYQRRRRFPQQRHLQRHQRQRLQPERLAVLGRRCPRTPRGWPQTIQETSSPG